MYRLEGFNRECTRCTLSTGKAVPGQSDCHPEDIVGIIVSDFPGINEEEICMSLAPDRGRDKIKTSMAAGAYLRLFINHLFNKDLPEFFPIEKFFYFTNAIKCKKKEEAIKDVQRRKCKETWFDLEISQLNPYLPILAAGSEAVKATLGLKENINKNRQKVLLYKQHPVIVTMNPINAERGTMKLLKAPEEIVRSDLDNLYQRRKASRYNINVIAAATYWKPLLPGSANWFFHKDLSLYKQEVLKYMKLKR